MSRLRRYASVLALAVAPFAAAAQPACRVEVSLEPARAFVGQQVLWRAEIERRSDVVDVEWAEAPRFPNLRAEWLPGRVEERKLRRGSALYLLREEHRALFAARAGRFDLPASPLRCRLEGGRSEQTSAPGVALRVDPLPEAGQPEDFSGLVGPLTVRAHVDRDRIALGGSLRLSVLLLGAANLWDAAPPHTDLESRDDLEVFRAPASLDLQTGDRLYVRRAFRMDLVPRAEGLLTVPATEVDYFDPTTGRYAVAAALPLSVSVEAREAPQPTSSALRDADAGEADSSSSMAALWAGLLLAVAAAAAVPRIRAAQSRRSAQAALEATLQRAEQAPTPREAAQAYERALRESLAELDGSLRDLDAGALAARAASAGGDRERLDAAARLLTELERCRFGESETPLDAARARSVIDALRGRSRATG